MLLILSYVRYCKPISNFVTRAIRIAYIALSVSTRMKGNIVKGTDKKHEDVRGNEDGT